MSHSYIYNQIIDIIRTQLRLCIFLILNIVKNKSLT